MCHDCLRVLLKAEAPAILLMKQAIAQGLVDRSDAHGLWAICSESRMSAHHLDLDGAIAGAAQAVWLLEAAVVALQRAPNA